MKNIIKELKEMEGRIIEIRDILLKDETDFDEEIMEGLEAIKFAIEDLEETVFEYE